jgi:RNA polymerase sigma factor (sigma-70 family)
MSDPFRKLAEQYSGRIYTFAYYSLRSCEEAEDVTQEVLIKLWENAGKVDPGRLHTWVMKVARNAVIDAVRRRQARQVVFADAFEIEAAETAVVSGQSRADHALHTAELRDDLEKALAVLEDPYRSIVIMREIQGMTYAEMADALELPLNTLRVYLHRGRKMLRESLKGKV